VNPIPINPIPANSDQANPLRFLRSEEPGLVHVVSNFLYDEAFTIEALNHQSGFSGAKIWRVAFSTGYFALRRWPNPSMPVERMIGLHRLLEHLVTNGLTFVASPLKNRNGETLINRFGHFWQLEPWLQGEPCTEAANSPIRLRNAMKALSIWHRVARSYSPDSRVLRWFGSNSNSPSPAVLERLARLESITNELLSQIKQGILQSTDADVQCVGERLWQLFQTHQHSVKRQLKSLQSVAFSIQPCLRDIWNDHVLYTNNEVTGIIDPSACRSENVTTDLARLIGSFVGDDRKLWDSALEEYQRDRPLSLTELSLLNALDRSGVLLSSWTWLEWLFWERRPIQHRPSVIARIKNIEARLNHLS